MQIWCHYFVMSEYTGFSWTDRLGSFSIALQVLTGVVAVHHHKHELQEYMKQEFTIGMNLLQASVTRQA